jgi:hypothetical protein
MNNIDPSHRKENSRGNPIGKHRHSTAAGEPMKLRTPEFREHCRRAGQKGGASRSRKKLDAIRKSATMIGKIPTDALGRFVKVRHETASPPCDPARRRRVCRPIHGGGWCSGVVLDGFLLRIEKQTPTHCFGHSPAPLQSPRPRRKDQKSHCSVWFWTFSGNTKDNRDLAADEPLRLGTV